MTDKKKIIETKNSDIMNKILEHAKTYVVEDTDKMMNELKEKYKDIILNHIRVIISSPNFDENLELLYDAIVKQIDKKYLPKPTPQKKAQVKKVLTEEQKQQLKEKRALKKAQNSMEKPKAKINSDRLFSIPVLYNFVK